MNTSHWFQPNPTVLMIYVHIFIVQRVLILGLLYFGDKKSYKDILSSSRKLINILLAELNRLDLDGNFMTGLEKIFCLKNFSSDIKQQYLMRCIFTGVSLETKQ